MSRKDTKGFTIVELLIVIVVIAILAAISIVAYTGIQNRAKASAGQQTAAQLEKKAQAFYTVANRYPGTVAAFASVNEAKLEGGSAPISGDVTAATADGGNVVTYVRCGAETLVNVEGTANTSTATGAQIKWWDYTKSSGQLTPRTLGTGC